MIKEITASLQELDKVVRYLNETLPKSVIVFLRGDLAAGKTTLTQAIAKAKVPTRTIILRMLTRNMLMSICKTMVQPIKLNPRIANDLCNTQSFRISPLAISKVAKDEPLIPLIRIK